MCSIPRTRWPSAAGSGVVSSLAWAGQAESYGTTCDTPVEGRSGLRLRGHGFDPQNKGGSVTAGNPENICPHLRNPSTCLKQAAMAPALDPRTRSRNLPAPASVVYSPPSTGPTVYHIRHWNSLTYFFSNVSTCFLSNRASPVKSGRRAATNRVSCIRHYDVNAEGGQRDASFPARRERSQE
jgi:hypothetical protein